MVCRGCGTAEARPSVSPEWYFGADTEPQMEFLLLRCSVIPR